MLQWLAMLSVAAGGVMLAMFPDATGLGQLPTSVIAVATLTVLTALYLVTSFNSGPRETSPWPRRLALATIAAATVAGIALGRPDSGKPADPFFSATSESEAVAATAQRQGPVAVRIRRSSDGRFSTQGLINGTSMPLVIDTGASAVLLRASDAERAGIALSGLAFDTPVATAGGTTYAAPVRLRSIQIGLISVGDVEALVAKPGSVNESLLGMSFLTRLAFHGLSGEFITLRN
jgi:aspartyl protease family protein